MWEGILPLHLQWTIESRKLRTTCLHSSPPHPTISPPPLSNAVLPRRSFVGSRDICLRANGSRMLPLGCWEPQGHLLPRFGSNMDGKHLMHFPSGMPAKPGSTGSIDSMHQYSQTVLPLKRCVFYNSNYDHIKAYRPVGKACQALSLSSSLGNPVFAYSISVFRYREILEKCPPYTR